jgi:PAS domain S-box-containing protein
VMPREQAINRFRSLNERIETLNREVYDRKQTAEISNRLRAIVDSCDDAIVSKDLNGIIESWNKGAERVFGYTAAEAIGQPITLIIPPDLLDEEATILERLKRGERVDHYETIRVRKDGSRVNISLSISPVRDESGRITGASKIARDVTERLRHEAVLQEANAALRRANEDLQQFAYSASHDLQEPLRMVAAYSELLQKRFGGQLGPTGDEYIRHTVQGAVRMEALLRDLRAYTQASMLEQQPVTTVDASEILQKTLLTLEDAIVSSDAAVQAGPLPGVRVHAFQLEQLFQNLIANAIRYRGAAAPRIQIGAEPRGDHWLFSVQDNGIGIDAEFKEQIFGIFKRLHNNAAYPGTGMGLAICQRIVERAGGRIWVESEPGRGSTFFFTIPGGDATGGNGATAAVLYSSGRG